MHTEAFAYRFDQSVYFNRLDNVDSIFPVKRLLCYHGNIIKPLRNVKLITSSRRGNEVRLNRIAIIIIIIII